MVGMNDLKKLFEDAKYQEIPVFCANTLEILRV